MNEHLESVLSKHGLQSCVASNISGLFSRCQYPKNTIVLEPGQQWSTFRVIQEGIFRLYYLDSEGKEANKGFFCEGQILAPIASSVIRKPANFFVETLTDAVVVECRYEDISESLSHLSGGHRVFEVLSEKLLEEKIQREEMFLQLDAKRRYEKFVSDFPSLHARIPLHHIASYLGMTNVTLSRIRNNNS